MQEFARTAEKSAKVTGATFRVLVIRIGPVAKTALNKVPLIFQ